MHKMTDNIKRFRINIHLRCFSPISIISEIKYTEGIKKRRVNLEDDSMQNVEHKVIFFH